jgi:hypothetical protein
MAGWQWRRSSNDWRATLLLLTARHRGEGRLDQPPERARSSWWRLPGPFSVAPPQPLKPGPAMAAATPPSPPGVLLAGLRLQGRRRVGG